MSLGDSEDLNVDDQLRHLLFLAIEGRRRAGGYVINDFQCEETYYPAAVLTELPEAGRVLLIALGADDALTTRDDAFTRIIPIQIAIQKLLGAGTPQENQRTIQRYRMLDEQIRDTTRKATAAHKHFDWFANEAMKDENGLSYPFAGLREINTFESFFNARYKVVLS